MSFFCRLTRRHYWCTPHRSADNRLVQVCYECGAERAARELHNEKVPDSHSLTSSSVSVRSSMKAEPIKTSALASKTEQVAAGSESAVSLALSK